MSRVSVIGAGRLGSKVAYTLAQRGTAREVVVVDIVEALARGQAMDISQSVAFSNDTAVVSGGYEDIAGSDIVVVTAGMPRTPDIKDRLELAKVNAKVVTSVCDNIRKFAPDSVVIICTNPMDLMNYVAYERLGFSPGRVVGFGGRLDSARLRCVVSKHTGVPTKDISADVAGEHGESMVPLFSRLKVRGKRREFSESDREKITAEVRGSALDIIKLKGITDFAPASCVCDMVDSIVNDTAEVMTCSLYADGVSIGMPAKISRKGAEPVEWKMSDYEKKMLDESRKKLEGLVARL